MTKKQKQLQIKKLKQIIIDCNFKIDHWNNYKKDNYRLKFKQNNLRFEKKTYYGWIKIFSKTIVKINLLTFEQTFKNLKKTI